jgi:citrate synthase
MAKTIIPDEFDNAKWGDKDHLEVAQEKTFTEMIFELLSERAPSNEEQELFDLILNLSIDHGPDTPSAVPTIEAAKVGKNMSEALAAGIMEIGDKHGGAAEPLMKELYRVRESESHGVKDLVEGYVKEGKRMPGFGHRIYKQSLPADAGKEADPRAQLIFDKMNDYEMNQEFIELIKLIRKEILDQTGKLLTVNIDGAIAGALCTMGFKPEAGKAIFIIARVPGLIGQYLNAKDV